VESAVKQSLQAYIPKVNELVDFKSFVEHNILEQNLIAHCFTADTKHISTYSFRDKKTLALIGPEGDFTREEIGLALERGFVPVSLGANRLRTETAGLYVCQAVSLLVEM
jgi:16S rRNA (uracil1498-N3)-methyltransferase